MIQPQLQRAPFNALRFSVVLLIPLYFVASDVKQVYFDLRIYASEGLLYESGLSRRRSEERE